MQDMGGKPVLTPAGRAAKKRKLRSRGHAKTWIAFSGVDGLARVREAHLELLEQTNQGSRVDYNWIFNYLNVEGLE